MWLDKSFKGSVFSIDTLEKKIDDYIINKYGLIGSYSNKGAIVIHVGIYSEIFLSLVNGRMCEITFKHYDESKVKGQIPLGKKSHGLLLDLICVWKVEIYDSYEDVIENIENFIEMYNDNI